MDGYPQNGPDGAGTASSDANLRGGYVSTGHLPSPGQAQAAVDEAYRMYRSETGGENSPTYPALARVPGHLFGICVAGISGRNYQAGDAGHEFAIMSVAKPFVFALACHALGAEEVRQKVRVNATGLPFDSLAAVEKQHGRQIESDGERWGHRRHEPGAGRQQRGEMAVHPGRAVPFRGTRPYAQRRDLRLRVGG
jgi:hypothetical protein